MSILEENYSLKGIFIINEESFITGNNVKILLRVFLYDNDKKCPLDELKEPKIIIYSKQKDNNDTIPSIITIEHIKLSYDKEFCFEYNVPPKLISIQLTLMGEIELKTENEKKNLKLEKCFYFKRMNDYDYLIKQNENDKYIIDVFGKNGEPLKGYNFEVSLGHTFLNYFNGKIFALKSDSEGKIKLTLPDVGYFELNSKKFKIKNNNKYNYKEYINISENKEINLPLNEVPNDKNNIRLSLLKINSQKSKLENLSDKLKIDITDKKNNLSHINLPKLLKGKYELMIGKKLITRK